jgi:PKD repeat protein
MELQELFRNKLENAEIVPDPSVSLQLMRRLARREFMTFNPARFNAYYLGGIMAAVIATALILSHGDKNTSKPADETLKPVNSEVSDRPASVTKDTVAFKAEINDITENKKTAGSVPVTKSTVSAVTVRTEENRQPFTVNHTDMNPAIIKNDLFKKEVVDTDMLIISSKYSGKLFVSSLTDGCVPLKVRFITTAVDIDSCRWTFGDGGVSIEKAPEWIFDADGEYKISLQVFKGGKLIGASSEMVKIYPRPVANFEISPANAVIPDDEIRFINYSTDAVKYHWNFGDGTYSELFEPHHKYSKYGNFDVTLTVYNEFGCPHSMLIQNAFSGLKYFLEFPNAFIPNRDGSSGGVYSSKSDESAQVFHPSYSGVSEYQLKIFSKIGILIFESNDINIGWDGYFNGQLSNSGVYIWKVRGKYRNGEPFTKMGDVTLLKN